MFVADAPCRARALGLRAQLVGGNKEFNMFHRAAVVLALSVLGAGCTSRGERAPLAANHPANPNASESPIVPPSQTLAASDAATTARADEPAGTQHDMSGMSNSMPGMQHDDRSAATQPATTQAAAIYTCPMHPQVISDKPGKCPICGMRLVVKQDAKTVNHGGHE
jgi:hypothetical protein